MVSNSVLLLFLGMGVSGQPLMWSRFLSLSSLSPCGAWLFRTNLYAFFSLAWDYFLFGKRRFSWEILGVPMSLHFRPSCGSLKSVSTELSDEAVWLRSTELGAALESLLCCPWTTTNTSFWSLRVWLPTGPGGQVCVQAWCEALSKHHLTLWTRMR